MVNKIVKEKAIEETLWQSCDKLRGSVEPAEYKHVVLGLIFLKFASDKFEQRRKELIAEGKEKYVEMKDFYAMKNVFYLDAISRWSYIIKNAKQNDISLIIDTALNNIEKNNPVLKGALPDNYFSRLALDKTKLASLLDTINEIDTIKNGGQDIIGRVYEYFLANFALKEGKGKGEFYTPKSIVNLIAEMIEPYKGIIYDPACGSGGMFVQSIKFIVAHHGNKKEVSIYGQEYTNTTYKLAKMNLAIRGISANLGEKAADTFLDDQHKDLKADFIMANPPFNQKDWRAENELVDDPRWRGYDVPPKSNANYGWILNMASKLSENGVAGFILANGALSGGGDEYKIRKKLIENDLVEAICILPRNMFYTTDISVTLWILNKNKKNRKKQVLFMDLRQMGEPFEKKFTQFSQEDIQKIAATFHTWRSGEITNDELIMDNDGTSEKKEINHLSSTINHLPFTINHLPSTINHLPSTINHLPFTINHLSLTINHYKDIPEFSYSANFDEIEKKDFSLVPSKYIEFVNRDEFLDYDEQMEKLQSELKELFAEEERLKEEVKEVFKSLGYQL